MNEPTMLETRTVADGTDIVPSYLPLPGLGLVPVNAFVVHAAQPLLIDTGLKALRGSFVDALRSVIDPAKLRWIWLTHTDPDHIGSLEPVLAAAPQARLVTNYLGMGKLSISQLPVDRVYLLNPGQELDLGDRKMLSVRPPSYDAPETMALFDTKTRVFFSSDCFGALMNEAAENASDVAPDALEKGMVTWATVDAPWLQVVDEHKYVTSMDAIRQLQPQTILSSHLPPARGMNDTLLAHLDAARSAPPFLGPDQAALEQMMAAASMS